MPTFGKVDEYNETEEWRHYIERVNHFFEANEITDLAKKRSIFLVSVGAKTYKLIRSLVAPADPKDKSYEELAKLVQDHYMPKPSAIVERFKFNTRSQQPGENIAMFLAELRHLTEHCEFGTTLDEMLRDRLVCGVRDIRIQRRLLAEPKLTLKRSLDLALAIEAAEKDVSEIQKGDSQEGNSSLNKVDVKVEQGADLKCYRCGGNHLPGNCYFKDVKCYACGKVGHLSRVCQGKKKGRKTTPASEKKSGNPQATHLLEGEEEAPTGDQGVGAYSLFTFGSKRAAPYKVQLNVAGQVMEMEVDTGASLSVISVKMYNNLSSEGRVPPLEKSEIVLRTYTGEEVKPKGSCTVNVSYQGADYTLPLLVVGGEGPALLGRNWLEQIKLYWPGIKQLTSTCHDKQLEGILQKHAQLFQEGLGTFKGTAAKIHVDPTATPIFHKAKPVPYALREKIEHDLERLEKAGTIEPVQYSEWATPIVPVMKSDDTVRVCGDYKLTVNKVSKLDGYPIPKLDDLYTKLAGGQTFTELDLSHAYEQMLVDEDSREFLTINTHKGLYRYNRLPYGVSSAPGIFQRTMEGLLQGIPSTGVLLDNILITGPSNEEHLANIEKVFERLSDAGLRLKAGKCQFMKPVLECLGHHVDAEGFHPVEAKVNAIKEAPAPTNPSELKSFLGMLNFYGKFLPNLSSTLEPLHLLHYDHTILAQKLVNLELPQGIARWIIDFLKCRRQRVKLDRDCLSEWIETPAGVPQGTKLGPWLFVLMIDDIGVTNTDLWKYVDDTTIAEPVHKKEKSNIQDAVTELITKSLQHKFQLNEAKCKELRISFAKCNPSFAPVSVNGKPIEVVPNVKLLGLNISHNLKWNVHVSEIIRKVSSRLYFLRQLKRAHVATKELLTFYITCIRPITEYACPVFHNGLSSYLSDDLEKLQKRALRIIFPFISYSEALAASNLAPLCDRRDSLTVKLFNEISVDKNHKLHALLPERDTSNVNLRSKRNFNIPICKTNRLRNSFIYSNCD